MRCLSRWCFQDKWVVSRLVTFAPLFSIMVCKDAVYVMQLTASRHMQVSTATRNIVDRGHDCKVIGKDDWNQRSEMCDRTSHSQATHTHFLILRAGLRNRFTLPDRFRHSFESRHQVLFKCLQPISSMHGVCWSLTPFDCTYRGHRHLARMNLLCSRAVGIARRS